MNFGKVLEKMLDEIEGVRALRMARQLDAPPGGEGNIHFRLDAAELLAELLDAPVGVCATRPLGQQLNFPLDSFQLPSRFFRVQHHFRLSLGNRAAHSTGQSDQAHRFLSANLPGTGDKFGIRPHVHLRFQ